MNCDLKIGLIPFGDTSNPYQELTRRALIKKGCKVHVFPKSNFFPLIRASYSDIEILHIDWPHSFYIGKSTIRTLLKKIMFKFQLKFLGPVKIVWTVHNLVTHNTSGENDRILGQLIEKSDALVSLSRIGVKKIRERWEEAKNKIIWVVPHGHFIDWYNTDLSKNKAKKILGIPEDARVGVLPGRLHPYKGIENLIPAFLQIGGIRNWLILAGKPLNEEYAAKLKKMINNNPYIILKDYFLPKKELEIVMAASDFAVFPFKEIFNSGSVILAMSYGLPIVATMKGSIPELVPAEALFDAGDGSIDEIKSALKHAYSCDSLKIRGNIAKQKLLKEHSWEIVSNRLVELYNRIISI